MHKIFVAKVQMQPYNNYVANEVTRNQMNNIELAIKLAKTKIQNQEFVLTQYEDNYFLASVVLSSCVTPVPMIWVNPELNVWGNAGCHAHRAF